VAQLAQPVLTCPKHSGRAGGAAQCCPAGRTCTKATRLGLLAFAHTTLAAEIHRTLVLDKMDPRKPRRDRRGHRRCRARTRNGSYSSASARTFGISAGCDERAGHIVRRQVVLADWVRSWVALSLGVPRRRSAATSWPLSVSLSRLLYLLLYSFAFNIAARTGRPPYSGDAQPGADRFCLDV
jgi:hypothetical protein